MGANADAPARVAFSSADLPPHIDDDVRFRRWHDLFASRYGPADIVRLSDGPFFARSEYLQIGAVGLSRSEASTRRFRRTSQQAAAGNGFYLIAVNAGASPTCVIQHGKEVVYAPDQMWLCSMAAAIDALSESGSRWLGIRIPAALLDQAVSGAERLVNEALNPARPAVRHLRRYVEFLLAADEIGNADSLHGRLDATLLDLVALSLGAVGDVAELAGMRGLRAARVQAIVSEIGAGFSNPGFSVRDVAIRIGVAPHSIQNLLVETGVSFTERVIELRLQKARAMLTNPRLDPMKIGDIAYASGFSEVPYFSRCFRRRFGCSPREYRNGRGARD